MITQQQKEDGLSLLRSFENGTKIFSSALWFDQQPVPKLIFGIRDFNNQPIAEIKQQLNSIIDENNLIININEIDIIDGNDSVLQAISMMISIDESIVDFGSNNINGINLPDSVIYRS